MGMPFDDEVAYRPSAYTKVTSGLSVLPTKGLGSSNPARSSSQSSIFEGLRDPSEIPDEIMSRAEDVLNARFALCAAVNEEYADVLARHHDKDAIVLASQYMWRDERPDEDTYRRFLWSKASIWPIGARSPIDQKTFNIL